MNRTFLGKPPEEELADDASESSARERTPTRWRTLLTIVKSAENLQKQGEMTKIH